MEAVRREADAWLRRLADREPTAVAVTAGTAVVLAVGLLVAFSRSSSSGASGGGDSDVPTKAGRGAGGAVEVDAVVTPVRPKRTSAAAAGGAGAPAAVVAITPATEETVAAAAASATAADVLPKPLLLAFLRELIENLQQFKDEMATRMPADEPPFSEAFARFQDGYVKGLKIIEDEMQKKYHVTLEAVVASNTRYADDAELSAEIARVRELFFGATPTLPTGTTSDTFYDAFCRHMDIVREAFQEAVRKARGALGSPEDRVAVLNATVEEELAETHARAVEAVGMTEEEYNVCLFTFQQEPRFVAKMNEMHHLQAVAREDLLRGE